MLSGVPLARIELLDELQMKACINFSKLKDGLFVSEVAPPYIFEIEKAIFTNTESIKKINLEIINKAENENQIL